ncbi:MAG: glutamine synthetase III [Bacteroidetes bacterium]|nr:glutamine synthetase III [Bacteroidota bacterium]
MPSSANKASANRSAAGSPTRKKDNQVIESKISNYFGENVFGPENQKQFLSKAACKAIDDAAKIGKSISLELAHEIAQGMKEWALTKGCTHYTHWFQPLRGTTAEKHDSFFEPSTQDTGVDKFSGKALVQQEPDASSFPSGGIRNTFEARGYTAWDPSSPAFIMEKAGVKTLCIPTIFVSYTGEALDYKAPLLKAVAFIRKAATDVCQYFDTNVKDCTISLGVEQEYFLVDSEHYNRRPDLMLSGRTLLGQVPAKGQQLEDHYFGSIPNRVLAYMADFEERAHKLGIPLRTRHNEVAPGQFECAPQFEEANLAVDHNSLLMDVMESVAEEHNLKVLLHEKPFKGINGSGKHNNWSIITNTGVNLLSPGNSPEQNLQFLTFFVNTIKAVYDHADLLRASIATAGNDHRLGANEAPPAIVSVFIGELLEHVLDDFGGTGTGKSRQKKGSDSIKITHVPEILLDNTDRNRTSPFAFTGNKFEFRAVGSSDNCASSMVVLNTIVGNQLIKFKAEVDEFLKENKGVKKDEAVKKVLVSYLKDCKKIIFGGNGYSSDWVKDAKRRGLNNITNTPEALEAYLSKSAVNLFVKNGIFSHKELEARTEIRFESYILRLQIEGRVLNELIQNHVIPAAIRYQKRVAENIASLLSIGQSKSSVRAQVEIVTNISKYINQLHSDNEKMTQERSKANKIGDAHKRAMVYCNKVKPYFDSIRDSSDRLEQLVDDSEWPLPKYTEMLFVR